MSGPTEPAWESTPVQAPHDSSMLALLASLPDLPSPSLHPYTFHGTWIPSYTADKGVPHGMPEKLWQ